MVDINLKNIQDKALAINLDPTFYGAFAEIGAGQEVTRNFFKVGAAAGTIAKTISAYDMTMSDAIYGRDEGERYVSQERLNKMLHREFTIVKQRIEKEGDERCFFAFADTIATTAFGKTDNGNGWIGVRFQHEPNADPSNIVIHINLKEIQPNLQQDAVGILGVNLLFAAFYLAQQKEMIVPSLLHDLSVNQVSIDMIRVTGPAFKGVNSRLLCLDLVKHGLAEGILFGGLGQICQPKDALYNKSLLVLRGGFRPPTLLNLDMIKSGMQCLCKNIDVSDYSSILTIAEISMNRLRERGEVDNADFLARVHILNELGFKVLISNKREYHCLSSYLSELTKKKISFVAKTHNVEELFEDGRYSTEQGGIFGALGGMFGQSKQLFVYPDEKEDGDNGLKSLSDAKIDSSFKPLLDYLISNNFIVEIKDLDSSVTHIWSRRVVDMIEAGDESWEEMVPDNVKKQVKLNSLFGYKAKSL